MPLIEASKIEGASVYGVEQYAYTVDGVSGRDYAFALTVACMRESVAVEANLEIVGKMTKERQRKLRDLSDVLTVLSTANGTFKTKEQESTDLSDAMDILRDAQTTALQYNINIPLTGSNGNQIRRGDCQTAVANVKHSTDLESNALQQDTVSLQNLINKRDSTFQTASTVVKKSLNAGTSAIKAMR